ncbi:hypothetical protein MRX96_047106 [Rhipicephalus microplus]
MFSETTNITALSCCEEELTLQREAEATIPISTMLSPRRAPRIISFQLCRHPTHPRRRSFEWGVIWAAVESRLMDECVGLDS